MARVEEKFRWIRAFEWIGSIDNNPLPYNQADFKIDFNISMGNRNRIARVIIKRAISEQDTMRRLAAGDGQHTVLLESKPGLDADETQPAVKLVLHNAQVSRYWLEDGEAETGRVVRDTYMERRRNKEGEPTMTITQALDAAGAVADSLNWDDDEGKQLAIDKWAQIIAAQTKADHETNTLQPRREVYTLHLPNQSAEEAPGIHAASNGMTLECIEFESVEFSMS